ncbi:ABC transporter permease [Sporosalibacterium faouarense]|uniref:ABC transporter permease n=1 Tax=Sporosalibacterium faouarense TaxID=516123 RepID=UPI00141D67CC|nr:ABC transporter permease subunit [Sporosalibacterium faouarense]MTI48766.1 ABC transporter permease subunit [Bacillota bacterium]
MKDKTTNGVILIGIIFIALISILPFVFLSILSFSQGWAWPKILPNSLSLGAWKYVFAPTSGTINAIFTSLKVAIVVTIINLVLAIPAGDALGRYKFKGKKIIEAILLMPIIIPPIIIMMGMHKTFIVFNLTESTLGVILCHIVPTLPYMIRAVTISYNQLGFKWEEQGKMLGAGKIDRFFNIVFPFLIPGIVAGSSLSIVISLSQYIITVLMGGGQVVTLPMIMFPFINGGNQGIGAAYSILFALIAVIALIAMDLLLKRYYNDRKIN